MWHLPMVSVDPEVTASCMETTSSSNEGSSKIPTSRTQEQRIPTTNLASRKGKVMGHIPEVENLENSVNLLNVDDIEEKLVKESSLLKSQILKQIHKNKGEINSGDMKNEQKKILEEQTAMNEKLKLCSQFNSAHMYINTLEK